jgi:hypothetical protein
VHYFDALLLPPVHFSEFVNEFDASNKIEEANEDDLCDSVRKQGIRTEDFQGQKNLLFDCFNIATFSVCLCV